MTDAPRDLPVITISLPGSLRAAQTLGIQSFLIKPVLREQLLDAIARPGAARCRRCSSWTTIRNRSS